MKLIGKQKGILNYKSSILYLIIYNLKIQHYYFQCLLHLQFLLKTFFPIGFGL